MADAKNFCVRILNIAPDNEDAKIIKYLIDNCKKSNGYYGHPTWDSMIDFVLQTDCLGQDASQLSYFVSIFCNDLSNYDGIHFDFTYDYNRFNNYDFSYKETFMCKKIASMLDYLSKIPKQSVEVDKLNQCMQSLNEYAESNFNSFIKRKKQF